MKSYNPEGKLLLSAPNLAALSSLKGLEEAAASGKILEARAAACSAEHDLIVDLPCEGVRGVIPRSEGAIGMESGETKDIALIARVNKPVCFKVIGFSRTEGGVTAILSRKAAQEECVDNYISRLESGDIIPARVTHLDKFGCFVDLGCGVPSLIPIDAISVSRISHPSDRFVQGQYIRVIVKAVEGSRVWLSHKELLGTWEENAALFKSGETVSGIVRSVEDYGIFIELTPNLAGLAEPRSGIRAGQQAGVYIKAIIPEKMKIKLVIVDVFDEGYPIKPARYFYDKEHISYWKYSVDTADKLIESRFGEV